MALLQNDKAIFYHPLNDATEFLKAQAWTESTPTFAAAKLSSGLFGTSGLAVGAEAEVLAAGAGSTSPIAALSTSKFVVAYQDTSDLNHGTARIGTVSGTTVTLGAETEFLSADGATDISIAALDVSKFVVCYRNGSASAAGTASIGTVSGTDITFATAFEFNTGTSTWTSVVTLSATKFVVAYTDSTDSGHGTAKVGTVSGTDITFGAEGEFNSAGGTSFIAAVALSATVIAVAYRDLSDSSHGTAKVGTVSGTDITFGAEAEFLSAGLSSQISATPLSSTTSVVSYFDNSDSGHGTAKVGTVSGTDITFGAEAEFLSVGSAGFTGVAALDDAILPPVSATEFVVVYTDGADSSHGTSKIGTVSGTDITFGAETEFLSAGSGTRVFAAALDASNFTVSYADGADSQRGKVKVGAISSDASLTATTPAVYDSAAAATKVAFAGWFKKPSA